jgi:hypothetical protein
MNMDQFQTLQSVDALNSWVRSKGAREWRRSPRNAIYDWKGEAIRQAFSAGLRDYHAIFLTLNCRDCGGSGRYVDSCGCKFDHCRKCGNRGTVRLTFLVTKIEGFVWHTPWEHCWKFRLPDGESVYAAATLSADWEPNAVGKDLDLVDVVHHLNVLEDAMPTIPGSHGVYSYGEFFGESDHKIYYLHLGRFLQVCEICGTPAKQIGEWSGGYPKMDGIYHGVARPPLTWSAWGCDACKAAHDGVSIFGKFPEPTHLIEHPEIQRWLRKRKAA